MDDLSERTTDATRCTSQDGNPAILLTGDIRGAEVIWHFANVIGETLLGENRGKILRLGNALVMNRSKKQKIHRQCQANEYSFGRNENSERSRERYEALW